MGGGGYKDRNRGFQSLALQKSKKYCRIQTGGLGPLTGGFCVRGGWGAEGIVTKNRGYPKKWDVTCKLVCI